MRLRSLHALLVVTLACTPARAAPGTGLLIESRSHENLIARNDLTRCRDGLVLDGLGATTRTRAEAPAP